MPPALLQLQQLQLQLQLQLHLAQPQAVTVVSTRDRQGSLEAKTLMLMSTPGKSSSASVVLVTGAEAPSSQPTTS